MITLSPKNLLENLAKLSSHQTNRLRVDRIYLFLGTKIAIDTVIKMGAHNASNPVGEERTYRKLPLTRHPTAFL